MRCWGWGWPTHPNHPNKIPCQNTYIHTHTVTQTKPPQHTPTSRASCCARVSSEKSVSSICFRCRCSRLLLLLLLPLLLPPLSLSPPTAELSGGPKRRPALADDAAVVRRAVKEEAGDDGGTKACLGGRWGGAFENSAAAIESS